MSTDFDFLDESDSGPEIVKPGEKGFDLVFPPDEEEVLDKEPSMVEPETTLGGFVPQAFADTEIGEDEARSISRSMAMTEDGFDRLVGLERGEAKNAIMQAFDVDIETAKMVVDLSQKTGVPADIVKLNPDKFSKLQRAEEITAKISETNEDGSFRFPITMKYMRDPSKVGKVIDREDELLQVEAIYNTYQGGFIDNAGYKFRKGASDSARGVLRSIEAGASFVERRTENAFKRTLDAIKSGDEAGFFDGLLSGFNMLAGGLEKEIQESVTSGVLKEMPAINTDGGVEGFATDVIGGVPQFAGSIVTGLTAGPVVAGGLMAGMILGGTYEDQIEMGVDPDRALAYSAFNGAVQGALESIGIAKFAKMVKVGGRNKLLDFFITAGTEGFTEYAQAYPESFARAMGVSDVEEMGMDRAIEIFVDEAAQTHYNGMYEGLIGFTLAGLAGSVHLAADSYIYRNERAFLDELINSMESTDDDGVEILSEMANDLDEQHGVNKIGLPQEVILELSQGDNDRKNEIIEELEIKDQQDQVEKSGGSYEVSVGNFLKGVAKDPRLKNYMDSIELDGVSENDLKEAREALTSQAELISEEFDSQQREETIKEELEQVRETMMLSEDRGGLGLSAEDADSNLQIFEKVFATQSRRAKVNITPLQLFNKVLGGVELRVGKEGEIGEEGGLTLGQSGFSAIDDFFKGEEELQTEVPLPSFVRITPIKSMRAKKKKSLVLDRKTSTNFHTGRSLNVSKNTSKKLIKRIKGKLRSYKDSIADKSVGNMLTRKLSENYIDILANLDSIVGDMTYFAIEEKTGVKKYFGKALLQGKENREVDVRVTTISRGNTESIVDLEVIPAIDPLTKRDTGNGIEATQTKVRSGVAGVQHSIADFIGSIHNARNTITFFQINGKKSRASVQFLKDKTFINMFEGRDKSSFLHESAHIFYRTLEFMVESDIASEQQVQDFQKLQEFVGTENVLKDGSMSEDGQEMVARGFEAYLREGRAPTIDMLDVFRNFKKWLVNIYKNVASLNIRIDDEVRGVFDRLIGTDEQIERMSLYHQARRDFLSLYSKNTGATRKRERSKLSAEDRLVKKRLSAYLKAIGGKKEIRQKVKSEVDNNSFYNTIDKVKSDGGFDFSEVSEHLNTREIDLLKRHNLVKANGQASITQAMIDGGYETERDMLMDISRRPTKKEFITKRVNEEILKIENNLRKDTVNPEPVEGMEDYHNEETLETIIAEMELAIQEIDRTRTKTETKALRDAYKKAIIDEAREIISFKKARDAGNYSRFSRSEAKYAKEAFDHATEGRHEKALEAKRLQALNHQLVIESIKARDMVRKIEKNFKTTVLRKKLDNTEINHANLAITYINRYKLASTDSLKEFNSDSDFSYNDLDDFMKNAIPQWIAKGRVPENFKNYKDLTISELEDVRDVVVSLIKYGQNEMASIDEANRKTIEQVRDESLEKMSHKKDIDPSTTDGALALKEINFFNIVKLKTPTLNKLFGARYAKIIEKARMVSSATDMFQFVSEELDNFQFTKTKTTGPMRRLYVEGRNREVQYNEIKKNVFDKLKDKFIPSLHSARDRIEKANGGKHIIIDGVKVDDKLVQSGRSHWTVDQMIAVLLNSGNASNKQRMESAYGYDQRAIEKIASFFTAEELKSFQDAWDAIGDLFSQINDVNFRLTNRNISKIEGEPITLPSSDGEMVTLKGGYYPLVYDSSISYRALQIKVDRQVIEMEAMQQRQANVLRARKPSDSMTQERVAESDLPPLLRTHVLFQHLSDSARFISHSEYLRDMNRLTKDAKWRESVINKYGKFTYNNIRNTLAYLSNPEAEMVDGLDRILTELKSMGTAGILGFNFSVGVKQRLSLFNAIQEIGYDGLFKGLKAMKWYSVNGHFPTENNAVMKEVFKKSKFMKSRSGFIDREISDAMNKLDINQFKFKVPGLDREFTRKDLESFAFEWIQMNDRSTVGVVWMGAYLKRKGELADSGDHSLDQIESLSVEYADTVVDDTQPVSLPISLTPIMQNKRSWIRLFTMFMSFTAKFGGRLGIKRKAFNAKAISGKEYISHIIHDVFMPSWSLVAISFLFNGDEPEGKDWLFSPAETSLSWLPIARDLSGAFRYNRGIGESPAFAGLNQGLKVFERAWKLTTDENNTDWDKATMDLVKTAEFFTKFPIVSGSQKMIRNFENTKDAMQLMVSGERHGKFKKKQQRQKRQKQKKQER